MLVHKFEASVTATAAFNYMPPAGNFGDTRENHKKKMLTGPCLCYGSNNVKLSIQMCFLVVLFKLMSCFFFLFMQLQQILTVFLLVFLLTMFLLEETMMSRATGTLYIHSFVGCRMIIV